MGSCLARGEENGSRLNGESVRKEGSVDEFKMARSRHRGVHCSGALWRPDAGRRSVAGDGWKPVAACVLEILRKGGAAVVKGKVVWAEPASRKGKKVETVLRRLNHARGNSGKG